MSLRYIPNNTKLSPIQMLLKSARDEEHRNLLKRDKKMRSFEYIYNLRRTMGMLISDSFILNEFFAQYLIENREIKKQIEKEQKAMLREYFSNNEFNRVKFEQDFTTILSNLSSRLNETEPSIIAIKLIDRNELRNGELKNPDVYNDLAEYKQRHLERNEEIKFLTMYLATASDKELKIIKENRPNSEIVEHLKNRDDFIKLRAAYHQEFDKAVKNDRNIKTRKVKLT